MRQLELQAGDLITAMEDWPCLPAGTQCVVRGEDRDKVIYCDMGAHPLADYEDEAGEIVGFCRAVNGNQMDSFRAVNGF